MILVKKRTFPSDDLLPEGLLPWSEDRFSFKPTLLRFKLSLSAWYINFLTQNADETTVLTL